jgi:hypothetical protein
LYSVARSPLKQAEPPRFVCSLMLLGVLSLSVISRCALYKNLEKATAPRANSPVVVAVDCQLEDGEYCGNWHSRSGKLLFWLRVSTSMMRSLPSPTYSEAQILCPLRTRFIRLRQSQHHSPRSSTHWGSSSVSLTLTKKAPRLDGLVQTPGHL